MDLTRYRHSAKPLKTEWIEVVTIIQGREVDLRSNLAFTDECSLQRGRRNLVTVS